MNSYLMQSSVAYLTTMSPAPCVIEQNGTNNSMSQFYTQCRTVPKQILTNSTYSSILSPVGGYQPF
jgi:hypothetical protein